MVRVHNTFPVRVLMDDKLVSDVAVPFFLPLTGKFFLFECIFFWWIAVADTFIFKKRKVSTHPKFHCVLVNRVILSLWFYGKCLVLFC